MAHRARLWGALAIPKDPGGRGGEGADAERHLFTGDTARFPGGMRFHASRNG